jgi:prophage DNA circulation protein
MVLSALLATLHGSTGVPGAQLRFQCGQLTSNASAELGTLSTAQFWTDLTACFDGARVAGASFQDMENVRVISDALTPISPPATALKNFAIRMSLAEQVQILAATTLTSRQDVDSVFDVINASFNSAIETAAGLLDNVAYSALVQMFATASNDLANRSRPLPMMVTYTLPTRTSAMRLAQFLYQDGSRYTDLILENKPVHPLFMPSTGEALSS